MPILNLFDPSVAVNTGTDTINIAAHGFTSIQGVLYSNGGGSSVGGLVDGFKYYIIYVDPDNFRLANTEVEARAGTTIDLLTAGTGSTHRFTSTTEYPNSAAYYDFFRKFRFIGTNITAPDGYIIEADNVRDTITFIGGTNIEFADPNDGINASIAINGPDYDLISPLGISNGASIRLENLGVEYQDVKLTSFRGIRIDRVSNSEIEFESFGVTETDTLHTVTSRGNLTSNNLVMNNLLVGKIQSTPGIDGFISVSVSAGDAYNGDGTLDNPIVFSPDESQRTDASYTVTLDFSSPSPGTFSYVAVFNPSATLASGYVKLERKNPSTLVWETLDYLAGTVARTTYEIQNIYAELNLTSTDYRITFNWTGNTEFVNYRVRLTYEVEPLAGNEIIDTDTDTQVLTLGTADGTVNLRGTIGVVETLNFDGLTIFQNNIDGNISNADVNIRPNGTGNLVVTADTDILGDLIVRGGDITTDQTTFNLLNTTATTVNAFGAANTAVIATNALSIQLGNFTLVGSIIDTDDSSGITLVPAVTMNSDLTVENDLRITHDLFVTNNTSITGSLTVGGGIVGNSTLTVDSNAVFNADVQIKGGDLTTNQTTFNLLNTTATTVNAFGAATIINLGALTGTTTVNNNLTVTGDLTVNGTTTTLNTATLDVEDLNITMAKGAISAAAANGAGLTVDGAGATLTYASADDSWNFNKLLKATSLEGTPIGSTTRAAGNFTSIDANGNVTLGDADTDTITVGGSFVTGTALRSAKTNSNTLSLAAYDVDGTAYVNLITLTASNTPTLALTSTGVGTINNMSIGATTRSTGAFTTGLVGPSTSANFTRFPGALAAVSTTDVSIQQNESGNIGLIAEAVATGATRNAGLYGVGYTSGSWSSQGVIGEGHVSATGDTAPSVGVRGYANDTHAGGTNVGVYADASGSAVANYALYLNGGDIISASSKIWTLVDNTATALSFDATGKTGILVVKTTDSSEGVTMSGTLGVTGATTLSSALTYGGVTLSNAVTGTGNMVLATAPTIAGGTHTGLTSLGIRDTSAAFDLTLAAVSSTALTAARTLTIDVVNAARTVKLGANIDIAGALTLSTALTVQTGAVTLTGQAAGSSVTLPSSGTVATIAGSESLTNKKLGSLTSNGIVTTSGSDGTLSVTATTGTGSVVLATNPTLSTPTYGTGSSNVDGDFTVDAASITYFAYLQSASGTARTINVSNLTSGRSITLFLRNSNAATKVVNIAASTTTTGFGAVLMSRGAGQTAATSVTLAATSGVATITVFNIGGTFAGSIG